MGWKHKEVYRSLIYLTKEEVEAMSKLDLSDNPKLDRARDIFLFGVYSCQRVSDYNNLNPSDIEEDNGEYYLHINRLILNEEDILAMAIAVDFTVVLLAINDSRKFLDRLHAYIIGLFCLLFSLPCHQGFPWSKQVLSSLIAFPR
jgi:integrase